ncbi:ubiquitin-conjugating enzyme/RWD-like protein [Podospora aff. communis PSN243]|uniref:E2 ubiquitin-conjugating enzyme n=1 Tax=Podospora aff. communis PSN243 TaxID=3040156 RepID=A0AAV9GTS0_9PEZI|nr:ubiquitin-conjugating enzyme/RWD-like protein [Podospora aff. communis PSN243]
MASQKRIAKELADCTTNPPAGMSISLANDSDVHKWHVILDGPPDSVYAGGKFGIIVTLPSEYPFKAPVVNFATRIYHPNITNDSLGNICLGLLKPENWKPASRLLSVLEAVRALLIEPQPDDPLEGRIADEYRRERKEFEKNAKAYVARYAKGPVKFDALAAAAAAVAAATAPASNTSS